MIRGRVAAMIERNVWVALLVALLVAIAIAALPAAPFLAATLTLVVPVAAVATVVAASAEISICHRIVSGSCERLHPA